MHLFCQTVIPCFCPIYRRYICSSVATVTTNKCCGGFVLSQTQRNRQRAMLKTQTISQQSTRMHIVPSAHLITGPSSSTLPVQVHKTTAPSFHHFDPLSMSYPPINVESLGPGTITDGDPEISSTSQPSFLDLGPCNDPSRHPYFFLTKSPYHLP